MLCDDAAGLSGIRTKDEELQSCLTHKMTLDLYRCSSLFQVQVLTAGSLHADTRQKPIFHSLSFQRQAVDTFHIVTPTFDLLMPF